MKFFALTLVSMLAISGAYAEVPAAPLVDPLEIFNESFWPQFVPAADHIGKLLKGFIDLITTSTLDLSQAALKLQNATLKASGLFSKILLNALVAAVNLVIGAINGIITAVTSLIESFIPAELEDLLQPYYSLKAMFLETLNGKLGATKEIIEYCVGDSLSGALEESSSYTAKLDVIAAGVAFELNDHFKAIVDIVVEEVQNLANRLSELTLSNILVTLPKIVADTLDLVTRLPRTSEQLTLLGKHTMAMFTQQSKAVVDDFTAYTKEYMEAFGVCIDNTISNGIPT